jgi:outer membrane protein TolC
MKRISLLICAFLVFTLAGGASAFSVDPIASDTPVYLTLEECVTLAMQRSPDISSARAVVNEKEAAYNSTIKDRLPTLSFRYDYIRQPEGLPPAYTDNYFSYALSVQQPLYRGRALVTAVELGKLDIDLAGSALYKSKNDLIFAVHQAYFDLLKSMKFEEVADQAVIQLRSHLKDAKAFYDAGLIPKNDLLTSEVQLAQGEQNLLRARNNSALARTSLIILLQYPLGVPIDIKDTLEYEPRFISWEKIIELAEEKRPELRRSRLLVQQADKNIILARAPFLPSVTLSATYKKQGDTPAANDYDYSASELKYAQATLQWDFWNWGQKEDKLAVVRQQERRARNDEVSVRNQVLLEVRKAFLDFFEAQKNIKVTEAAVAQAEENFRINRSRFHAQLNTSTDVLDAQILLTRAKLNYFNALYDYRIASAALDWSTGTLAENYEEDLK